MSLSYQKLQPVLVEDPVTQVNATRQYAVLQSGNQISWKAYTSTSISNSSIQFSAPPPSSGCIVDRMQYVTIPVRLTFTGVIITSNGAFVTPTSLLTSGRDAPRAYPFSSALDTLQVGINNDSVSINMSDVIHPLTRYNTSDALRAREFSMSPNYPDQSFNYSELVGQNRNPLGNYADGFADHPVPRGGFAFTIVSNTAVVPATGAGTAATAVVDMLITEPLFLSPFFWGRSSNDIQGFYNVNAMDFNLTFLARAGFRMWSHADGATRTSGADTITSRIDSISVQFNAFSSPAFSYTTAQPQMLFKYYTPNLLTKQRLSPLEPVTYPYFDVTRYPTDLGLITYASGVNQVTSNNIQLNQIPRKVYIFARPSNASLQSDCTLTDTYLVINNISIQFANQSTLMSSATQQQLYMINVKNHSEQSWQEWSGQLVQNDAFLGTTGALSYGPTGGPLCLEFGTDIQLSPDEAPGLSGQYMFQVTVGLSNMNALLEWDDVPMTLYCVFVCEGTMTITAQGAAQHQLSVLSKMDILDAQKQQGINYRKIQEVNGGDFLDSLGNFASRVNDFLKQSKIISTVGSLLPHPGAQLGSKIAENLGYGYEGGCEGGIAIQGGKRMTKAQLKRNLLDR